MTTLATAYDCRTEQPPVLLLCGAIEHLTCYLRTRRPRSARRTVLLLERLMSETHADPALAQRCAELCEAIDDALASRTEPDRPVDF